MDIKQWNFMMDWCKKHKVSPVNIFFWDKAKEAYKTGGER